MAEFVRCQVAVVGSGSGGAITAATLSARGFDVVMIAEGPYLTLDSCPPFSIEELRQKSRCGGLNPALGAPNVPLAEAGWAGRGRARNAGPYRPAAGEIPQVPRVRIRAAQ